MWGDLLDGNAQHQPGVVHFDDHYALPLADLATLARRLSSLPLRTCGANPSRRNSQAASRISSRMPPSAVLTCASAEPGWQCRCGGLLSDLSGHGSIAGPQRLRRCMRSEGVMILVIRTPNLSPTTTTPRPGQLDSR